MNIDGTGAPGITPDPPGTPGQVHASDRGKDAHCSTWGDNAGTPGADGNPGYFGSHGLDGQPGGEGSSYQLVVVDLFGGLSIDCSGGNGGNGGQGGKGGQGGNGGDGGTACDDDDGPYAGGRGGTGGQGGDGGVGADGGNGGDITIIYTNFVGDTPTIKSAGGRPGIAGQPGPGGDPGVPGMHGDGHTVGPPGSPGPSGQPGLRGGLNRGRNGNIVIAPHP